MRVSHLTKGQSLIEILLAVAVFTVGVVTIGFLVLESFASMSFALDSLTARLLSQEGLEAARAIRDDSFARLEPGTYGLAYALDGWELASSPDTQGKFTRSITITEVDPEIRQVTSSVSWEYSELSLATYFSNWRQNAGEAADIMFDLNNATLLASSTHLFGIALINNGTESSTVTQVAFQFEGAGAVTQIDLGGQVVYAAGTSSAPVSGDSIDIADYAIEASSGYRLLDVHFTQPLTSEQIVVSLQFNDGSKKHARLIF